MRARPAGDANEHSMLSGWLDWQRHTVRMKCAGLSEDDARRAVLPSSPGMTVVRLVSHLTWVEHTWFEKSFLGMPSEARDPLGNLDPVDAPLPVLLDRYDLQCDRSREIVAAHALDELEAWAPEGLEVVSLRWIVGHLLEETARHLGHLDAIRELLDGTTGD